MVAGVGFAAALFGEGAGAGSWLPVLYACVNGDVIAGASVGCVEGDSFQLLVAFGGKNIRRCATGWVVRICGDRVGPADGVVLIVVGVIVGFFKQIGIAAGDGLVFVGKPEIAVVAPAVAPAVAHQPGTVVLWLIAGDKVFFWIVVVPANNEHSVVRSSGDVVVHSVGGWIVGAEPVGIVVCADWPNGHDQLFGDGIRDVVVCARTGIAASRHVVGVLQMKIGSVAQTFVEMRPFVRQKRRLVVRHWPFPGSQRADSAGIVAASEIRVRQRRVFFLFVAVVAEPGRVHRRKRQLRKLIADAARR